MGQRSAGLVLLLMAKSCSDSVMDKGEKNNSSFLFGSLSKC